jgi:hypothetical protein
VAALGEGAQLAVALQQLHHSQRRQLAVHLQACKASGDFVQRYWTCCRPAHTSV